MNNKYHANCWDDILFQILVNGFLITILVIVIIPLWRVLIMSVTPLNFIDTKAFGLWLEPRKWSFEAYKQLLSHPSFVRATTNSIIITLGGITINMLLTVPFAYALSNPDLPGRKFFITMVMIPFLFNAGLIPTYLVVQKLSLIDTYWAVILPGGDQHLQPAGDEKLFRRAARRTQRSGPPGWRE